MARNSKLSDFNPITERAKPVIQMATGKKLFTEIQNPVYMMK